jgi:nuclear pore complex protein Nup107
MECMDLSSILAGEDSDLLELFMKVGRMQELVESFAAASKSLLLITAAKGSSKSKKLRTKGWTPELWTVKP